MYESENTWILDGIDWALKYLKKAYFKYCLGIYWPGFRVMKKWSTPLDSAQKLGLCRVSKSLSIMTQY